MEIRTFGIFAHVDAGKTTLTEAILLYCKAIKAQGRVDEGTAHTDRLEIEKKRGISVQSCPVTFMHRNVRFHLIDTPGHLDFTHEVEAALKVIDGAIILLSAVEGVQPHTQIIFDEVKKFKIPTIIFINKIDRIGASVEKTVLELKESFSDKVILMQNVCEDSNGSFQLFDRLSEPTVHDDILNVLCDFDDILLNKYIEGDTIRFKEVSTTLNHLTKKADVYPIYTGAALYGIGIPQLIEGIINYLPGPIGDINNLLSAVVFKVENHKTFGRMAYVRIYDGRLGIRQEVRSPGNDKIFKVNQIKMFNGERFIDTDKLTPGDIGAVSGISGIKSKEPIGEGSGGYRTELSTGVPVMRVKVYPVDVGKINELLFALQTLNDENPAMNLVWISDKKEFNIDIFGPIQVEILKSILEHRFGLDVEFGSPAVIYMETPVKEGEGFVSYTMPKPCWAVIRFLIKPGALGSGVIFHSVVRHDVILSRYQKQIEEALPMALSQGIYGWKVTDIDITLIDGEYHPEHTKAPDFTVATPMAVMDGLNNIGTYLLEPVLYFDIKGPETCIGAIIKKLTDMRCIFDSPGIINGLFSITGEMPVATSMNFPVEFGILTHGKGIIKTKFLKRQICSPELGGICERRGVNPLDRAKYILSVRNAL